MYRDASPGSNPCLFISSNYNYKCKVSDKQLQYITYI